MVPGCAVGGRKLNPTECSSKRRNAPGAVVTRGPAGSHYAHDTAQHSNHLIYYIVKGLFKLRNSSSFYMLHIQYYINGYLMHRVIYMYVYAGFFYMVVAISFYQNNLPSLDHIETKQFPQSGIDYIRPNNFFFFYLLRLLCALT